MELEYIFSFVFYSLSPAVSPMEQRNTRIPLVSNEECVEFTKTITKRLVPYVTDEKICAGFVPEVGTEGTGACRVTKEITY